ncbi:MAG: hypothetical protein K0Q50_2323 [Vampirovibrio sp.]|jgi:hypothetical protein|nr:hypothetical protein [Vampirovibrio sp.]
MWNLIVEIDLVQMRISCIYIAVGLTFQSMGNNGG